MADTVRTLPEILALLPDNSTGDISPQDLRDQTVTLYRDIHYDDYAAFAASTEGSRGVGAIWRYGPFSGEEVASGGDISNAAGTPVQLDVVLNPDGSVNATAFGADTAIADNQPAIQAALDAYDHVVLPEGEFKTESPIYIDRRKTFGGAGPESTTILKTTTTAGTGSNTFGAFTDSYAKNAILIFRHSDEKYTYNTSIRDLKLESDGYLVDYGMYCPRVAQYQFSNVEIFSCRYGVVAHDMWFGNMFRVIVHGNSVAPEGVPNVAATAVGWTDSKGFWWDPSGSTGGGTAMGAVNCWARNVHVGWDLKGLSYSSFNACGADNITGQAWFFNTCLITLSGCGMENVQGERNSGSLQVSGGHIVLDNFNTFKIYGKASGSVGLIAATDGGKLSIRNSDIDDFNVAASGFNIAITGGSHVTVENSVMPTNGNSFISFSSGSSLTTIDGKDVTLQSEDTGSNKLYRERGHLFGNAIQETKDKSISATGTDIATITALGSANPEMGSYQFRVVWRDTNSPFGMGIDTFDVIVTRTTSPSYTQSVTVVNNSLGGSGITTPPVYSVSRVGDVWTVRMAPVHGLNVAMSIKVQEFDYAGMTLAML